MSQILVSGSATSVKEVPNKYLSMSDLIKKFDLSYMVENVHSNMSLHHSNDRFK